MLRLPILDIPELRYVVNSVMTAGRQTRRFVVANLLHDLRIGVVRRPLLEAARAFMAVQALPVLERLIQFDLLRAGNCSQILYP